MLVSYSFVEDLKLENRRVDEGKVVTALEEDRSACPAAKPIALP